MIFQFQIFILKFIKVVNFPQEFLKLSNLAWCLDKRKFEEKFDRELILRFGLKKF